MNADVLSCLPLPVEPKEVPIREELVMLMENLQISPVTVTQVKRWTDLDPVLSTVRKFVQQGWPRSVSPDLHP